MRVVTIPAAVPLAVMKTAEKAREYVANSRAENTRRAYRSD